MAIRPTDDIRSVTDLKRKTREILDQIHKTGRPVILTVNGKADAVLMDAVTSDPLYRKTIRTAMGASLRVPFARLDWTSCLAAVRAAGLSIVTLTPREPAETLERFAAERAGGRLALVLGNEGQGVSETTLAATDHRIRIPTSGDVDSLNVAVASGIALARLTHFASV